MDMEKFSFYGFADWLLNTANQVVKHYKGDILFDIKRIVELRNSHLFNPQRVGYQRFSLYWGLWETGTWLYHVDGDNSFTLNDLTKCFGVEHVYLITFQYDQTRNETITVREVDPDKL